MYGISLTPHTGLSVSSASISNRSNVRLGIPLCPRRASCRPGVVSYGSTSLVHSPAVRRSTRGALQRTQAMQKMGTQLLQKAAQAAQGPVFVAGKPKACISGRLNALKPASMPLEQPRKCRAHGWITLSGSWESMRMLLILHNNSRRASAVDRKDLESSAN